MGLNGQSQPNRLLKSGFLYAGFQCSPFNFLHSLLTIQICGGSNQTYCPGGNIGACQIKRGEPTFHKKLGKPNDILFYYDGMLNLTYRNGEPCHNGVNRTTHITFLCNRSAVDNGVGVPEYEKEDHCVYNFRWFTKYACLTKVSE